MSKKIISIFLILTIISGLGIVEAKNISKDNRSYELDWKPVNKTIDIEKVNLPITESAIINKCSIITSPGIYTLNTDVTNSSADACIIIISSNVLLDGQGHTIDGIDGIDTFGVYVHNPDTALYNVSVKNLKVIDWYYGIYYKAVTNGILSNNIADSNILYGIFLDNYAGGNTLKNNNASFNWVGYFIHAGYNKLENNTATTNDFFGFTIYETNKNILTNNVEENNSFGGFELYNATNNTLKNNKATAYFGFLLIYSNRNTIENNDATNSNNAIGLEDSDNNTVRYNKLLGIYSGIRLYSGADYNTLKNNKATAKFGFLLSGSNRNTIENNDATNSNNTILLQYSTNNTIRYNKFNGKDTGIILYEAYYNTFTKNRIIGAGQYGFWVQYSDDNLFYDNLFNNTNNYYNAGSSINKWNINPKSCIINIINGPLVAGNVWDTPVKSGISQTCTDDNRDGLCDSPFILDADNVDYKPEHHNVTGDKTPPNTVSNLRNISYVRNYIKWAWLDPTNADFSYVKVYIDGNFKCGVLNGVKAFNATGLLPNTIHTIGTKTVDTSGNEGNLKTNTSKTKP